MGKRHTITLIKIIVLIGIVFTGYMIVNSFINFKSLSVASWNLEIFGDKKAGDAELMNFYADKIKNYDVVFIQEIRDIDGSAFSQLCGLLQNYSCKISSRAGTTSVKEQYGIIYRDEINLIYMRDYNPQESDKFERPPIEVQFEKDFYKITIFNIHVKPDNVKTELENLEAVISDYGNVMVLGDLNADCTYYNAQKEKEFDDWKWVVSDGDDTTSGETDCAYDRILLNSDAEKEYLNYGIARSGIDARVSDHYLIWIKMKI